MATENIPSRLHSVAEGNVVAGANEIFDDTKEKKQNVINQETDSALENQDQRIQTLETAVGTGGSVDSRIESAKTEIVGGASSDCNTLGKAETLISTNANDIAALQDAYAALTQNDVVVVAPTDTWPVATPEQNTIYRVVDRTNTPPQYYTDYMWNGTAFVEMARYNNAIDAVPTAGSHNLVESGGVQNELALGAVYDVTAHNSNATFDSLEALLSDANLNTLIPTSVRKGGMSIKFVQSSDNKYVQLRYTSSSTNAADFTNVANWQLVCASFPFLDMDYIAPISNGYHTPTTARVAVPEIYRKYGLVIQYRISSSEIRVEQFIEDSFGYNLNDNCWNTISPNNKKQPFTSLRELIYSGYKVNIETGASSSDSAYDMTRPISVIPGRTYYCENLILSVAYYGADLNWNNSTSRTRCFISGDTVNGHSITVPNNCYYVVINFKKQQLFTYEYVHLIDNKSFVNKLTNIDEPLSKTALPVQPFIQLNMACSLSDGSINDNNNYACCILPIKSFTSYVIRCRYNQDSGLRIVLWYSDFPSTDSFMDYVAVTNESQIFNAPQGAKWVGLTFTNRSFDSFHDTCWLEAIDVNPCVIRRSGPSFTEYRFNNAPDNSRVSVGMLGTTEANLSYNMDYRTGVHKAYDSTKGAMWLALNGANYAFQYAPENMSTEGDVWENGGKQLALWGNVNQLAACIDSDDAKGTACIFGKRKVQESATFAGFNDCIIEGDRVKGVSAPVYINRYNNGKVSIAVGGGNLLVGTETDDNVNKLQVNGSVKASQFRLSSLNTAPSSASDTGTAGEIRVTSDYIYVCIATNTWVRSALESW